MEKKERKRGNKKVLVIALLLLLVAASFGTYAIYKSSATGSGTAQAAAWVVKVNTTSIVGSTQTFDLGAINWSSSAHVASGKIAPGSTGTVNLTIDATGSEVSLDYAVTVKSIKYGDTAQTATTVVPDGTFTVSAGGTGSILVNADSKTASVPITLTWTGTDDETQNATDVSLAGKYLAIEVEVTATQKLS